ncbi:MAG: hypothetical protein LUF35_03530 [Lachnospiraceae bacterium]|nr:hypothetical protein [Lachnospiraceae bacterium]
MEAREAQYRPGWIFFHVTISIDRDYERLYTLYEKMRQDFEPFVLEVESVRLYHVWPPREIG